jgi:hypothetical protein
MISDHQSVFYGLAGHCWWPKPLIYICILSPLRILSFHLSLLSPVLLSPLEPGNRHADAASRTLPVAPAHPHLWLAAIKSSPYSVAGVELEAFMTYKLGGRAERTGQRRGWAKRPWCTAYKGRTSSSFAQRRCIARSLLGQIPKWPC